MELPTNNKPNNTKEIEQKFNQYYNLLTFICEIFPEKIPQLPEDLFKSLMYSLELGMTSYPLNACHEHLALGKEGA